MDRNDSRVHRRRHTTSVDLTREATDTEPGDGEHASGIGLPRTGVVVKAGSGGGHEQGGEVGPTECA